MPVLTPILISANANNYEFPTLRRQCTPLQVYNSVPLLKSYNIKTSKLVTLSDAFVFGFDIYGYYNQEDTIKNLFANMPDYMTTFEESDG